TAPAEQPRIANAAGTSGQHPGNEKHPEQQSRYPLLQRNARVLTFEQHSHVGSVAKKVRDAGAAARQTVAERMLRGDFEEVLVDASADSRRHHTFVAQRHESLEASIA